MSSYRGGLLDTWTLWTPAGTPVVEAEVAQYIEEAIAGVGSDNSYGFGERSRIVVPLSDETVAPYPSPFAPYPFLMILISWRDPILEYASTALNPEEGPLGRAQQRQAGARE